ncbi:hypothetical protein CspHIS471_0510650 [Cutaneotrichosporon sp. HIS471]|nr:hypothetical protein CspHIS471_0510650 [Cutaneotrichosporon sp. HIS471]
MSIDETSPLPVNPAPTAAPANNAGLPIGTDSVLSSAANPTATENTAPDAEFDALHIDPKREASADHLEERDQTENAPADAPRLAAPQPASNAAPSLPAGASQRPAHVSAGAHTATPPTSLRLPAGGAPAAADRPPVPMPGAHSVQPGMRPPQGPVGVVRPPAGRGMAGPMGMRAPMGGPMGMGGRGAQVPIQTRLPPSLQAKMDKLAAQRSGAPSPSANSGMGPAPAATSMGALLRQQAFRAGQPGAQQGPNAGPLGLAARRAAAGRLTLNAAPGAPAGRGGLAAARGGIAGRRGPPGGLSLAQMGGPAPEESMFKDFGTIVDPNGSLKFSKAILHAGGVDFGDGQSFKINMDEIEVLGELGKGNYGSVQKVFHRPTGVTMAMKLDESKLNGIIMELDILHRAASPEIVEFYGAFTIESCVYYCMEFMDAGSLDKLTSTGGQTPNDLLAPGELLVPEPVLRRITAGIVRGLRFLKDELQIMHRDVKPTNVLMNRKGEVKLCDFGVSGQLEKSLAKTNIGCQSYMAPERIRGESQNQVSTYTVSSDVWSVGLSIIELAKGCYPYPPETFSNVFAQLTAIVNGPAPTLPPGYSDDANDFIAKCLLKDPAARPTYGELLQHPFLLADKASDVDMAAWVAHALERQAKRVVIPLAEVAS